MLSWGDKGNSLGSGKCQESLCLCYGEIFERKRTRHVRVYTELRSLKLEASCSLTPEWKERVVYGRSIIRSVDCRESNFRASRRVVNCKNCHTLGKPHPTFTFKNACL